MRLATTPTRQQQQQQHCASSSASVSSCGNKRNRRFSMNSNNCNNNTNATFPTTMQGTMNASTMLPSLTMNMNNNRNYQQHHCDVMNAARNILSNDPINTVRRPKSQYQSNFSFGGSMNRPHQQFQQQQQF